MDPEWHFGSTVVAASWGDNGRVGEIRATGPKGCPDTGVCPGMGLREIPVCEDNRSAVHS